MNKKQIIGLCLLGLSFHSLYAQKVLPANVAAAVSQVRKGLLPDHQSQFLEVSALPTTTLKLHVETTSETAAHRLDSLLPGVEKEVLLLPQTAAEGKSYGIVRLSVANHRGTPEQSGEMWTQSLLGTAVRILKTLPNGYYLVQSSDGYISYTEPASIFPVDEKEKNAWDKAEKIIYTQFYGHVFGSADKESLPISDIVAGDQLELLGKKGKFYQVRFPDSRVGFVLRKESEKYSHWLSETKPDYPHILQTAQQLMGVPYLWGGTSIKGVDCSGFIRTSFLLNGVLLPRDASQQARVGELVDIYANGKVSLDKALQQLQQGDLLFFGDKRADGSDHVTHVAMYMGQGKFIQASGLVKISEFSATSPDYDAYHVPMLLSARRVLSHIGDAGIAKLP